MICLVMAVSPPNTSECNLTDNLFGIPRQVYHETLAGVTQQILDLFLLGRVTTRHIREWCDPPDN